MTTHTETELDAAIDRFARILDGAENSNAAAESALMRANAADVLLAAAKMALADGKRYAGLSSNTIAALEKAINKATR